MFIKPLRLGFLTVLMTASASPQGTLIFDSHGPVRGLPVSRATGTARAAVAGTVAAARSGSNPTSENDASANAASTLLIGERKVESQVGRGAVGQAKAFPAVAINSGTVRSLSVYLDASSASTQLFLGIYIESGTGHPSALLGQGSSTHLRPGAWNTIHVSPISVSKGRVYWIAVLGAREGQPAFRDRYSANCDSETSSQTNLTSLPATWKTGKDWPNSCQLSAYGLGSGPPVGVLTASPSSVNFEDVIVGDSSALPVMLTNTGTASLTISAATPTGAGFGLSGLLLPLTLNPGHKASFSADFVPAVTGTATGEISLTSNASDPTYVVALSGIGVKPHWATLSWTASKSSRVIGYNVYRGSQSGGPYSRLNPALVAGTSYTDATVQAGQTYYYVATAVNSRDVESSHSNQAQAVVPFP